MSEERELLRETVAALGRQARIAGGGARAMASEHGYDESLWKLLCEQVGAAALVVPGGARRRGRRTRRRGRRTRGARQGAGADAAAGHHARRARAARRRRTRHRCDRAAWPRVHRSGPSSSIADYRGQRRRRRRRHRRRRQRQLTTLDRPFTAHPVDTMDLTRRLARIEPQDTTDIGADPGSGRHRGDPVGRRADRRAPRSAST